MFKKLKSLFPPALRADLAVFQAEVRDKLAPKPEAVKEEDVPAEEEFCVDGAANAIAWPVPPEQMKLVVQQHLASLLDKDVLHGPHHRVLRVSRGFLSNPDRLSTLVRTGWLDSPPEAELDALTRLASELTHAPVAVVSLVDTTRQFFKSQTGLPDPWAQLRETPLTHAFCQWVVLGKRDLVIPDATKHKVLYTNRAVHELGVVAYAGVPIMVGHECIGSFCSVDTRPKAWTREELADLHLITDIINGYAAVAGVRRAEGISEQWQNGNTEILCRFLATGNKGIASANHLLKREAGSLTDAQKKTLEEAAEHLALHLRRFANPGATPAPAQA